MFIKFELKCRRTFVLSSTTIGFSLSIYWGAMTNRYKEDCQSVIDSKEEWYDKVPSYAVRGS